MPSTLTESFRLRSIYKLLRGPEHAIVKIKDRCSSTLEQQSSSIFTNQFEQLSLVSPESEPFSSENPTPTEDATHHQTSEVPDEDTAGPSFILTDDYLARDFELLHTISVSIM